MVRTAMCALMAVVAVAAPATAQPSIGASVTPAPNQYGWNNSHVTISYTCRGVSACPGPVTVSTEGDRQLFRQTVTDDTGRSATVSTEVSIDFTPAEIALTSPSHKTTTTAAAAAVTARVTDARSGLDRAACNGAAAVILGADVSCVVQLRDGINDLVVQVLDRAGNSSSHGVQVHRIGRATSITVIPSELALLVGQLHTPQVVDNFGRTITDVDWSIDTPSVVSFDDVAKTLIGTSPGETIITAKRETLTSSMKLRVFEGSQLPDGTIEWAIPERAGYRNNEPIEVIRPMRVSEETPSVISIEHEIGGSGLLLRAFDDVPHQRWIETPAVSASERLGEQVSGDEMGGGLLRVDAGDGRSGSIVRVGRSEVGTLWRYSPAARLSAEFAYFDGIVDIVETPADGFPALVRIDGLTGAATSRIPLPRSSVTLLNAGCVEGADTRIDRPAEVGLSPTVLDDGIVNLAVSTAHDVENALPCKAGTIRRQRTVQQLRISPDGRATYRTVYEYPPSGDRIDVVLNKVLPDGHDGQLVAWSARIGRQPFTYTVVRVDGERLIRFELPALGPMIIAEEDMGVTTDGRTIVGFDITSGQVLWSYRAPANGSFRLLMALAGGGLTVATESGVERIDRAGHRVPMPGPR